MCILTKLAARVDSMRAAKSLMEITAQFLIKGFPSRSFFNKIPFVRKIFANHTASTATARTIFAITFFTKFSDYV
jgi:hypothetical protein